MSKYRILKVQRGWCSCLGDAADSDGYVIQKKGWFFWNTLCHWIMDGPAGAIVFNSYEEAENRILKEKSMANKPPPTGEVVNVF